MTREILGGNTEALEKINFQMCNFPPAVIGTPDINKLV